MNGYNFTQAVRRALSHAREEAARLHHGFVGTEHELLGLLVDRPNIALDILERHKVGIPDLRSRIEVIVTASTPDGRVGPDLPYTSRAKKSLEYAMSEARQLDHTEVNCGHLLLGLVRERDGVAGQVLREVGVTLDSARGHFVDLLAQNRRDPGDGIASIPHMTGEAAAMFLQAMSASPVIAPIFAKHEIDLPRLIEDVRNAK